MGQGENMGRKISAWLAALMLVALTACGPAPEAAPTATPVPEVTEPPQPTPEPVTRRGGWLDGIHLSAIAPEEAARAVASGSLGLYTDPVYPWQNGFDSAAPLCWPGFLAITFNPVPGEDMAGDSSVNPFADPAVRRAVSRAVDRDAINSQFLAGRGLVKYVPLSGARTEIERCRAACDDAAGRLSYDLDAARAAVDEAMAGLGARKEGGVWAVDGSPVTVRCLIQGDGGLSAVGEYVADCLEELGFAVERIHGTAEELAGTWLAADPSAGGWHVHVGLWDALPLSGNEGAAFLAQSRRGPLAAYPLWQRFAAEAEAEETFLRLASADWSDEGEHEQLLEKAISAAAQMSYVVYLADVPANTPVAENVTATQDVVAGAGGPAAALTLRIAGQEGGGLHWGAASLFDSPFNPFVSLSGGDRRLADLLSGGPLSADPVTGAALPLQMASVEFVGPGLSASWSVDSGLWQVGGGSGPIQVPGDALARWDAQSQTWRTAADVGGLTATTRTTVVYRSDLPSVTWHDGSPLSAADFMMAMIMAFDPADPASPCYDGTWAAFMAARRQGFVAFSITATDPLTVVYYGSGGNDVYAAVEQASLWPRWGSIEGPWHVLALGNLAQADGVLAWSPATAAMQADTPLMDLTDPACTAILAQYARQAMDDGFIPYEPTMGRYVSADEAGARYGALLSFYEQYGHLCVGTGPYILTRADRQGRTADLINNAAFIDLCDRWNRLLAQ